LLVGDTGPKGRAAVSVCMAVALPQGVREFCE
jgi:hypothetical protein